MKTKVVLTEFKNHKLFTIRRVNEAGEVIEEIKPIISMGIKKVSVIIDNLDELKRFYELNRQGLK